MSDDVYIYSINQNWLSINCKLMFLLFFNTWYNAIVNQEINVSWYIHIYKIIEKALERRHFKENNFNLTLWKRNSIRLHSYRHSVPPNLISFPWNDIFEKLSTITLSWLTGLCRFFHFLGFVSKSLGGKDN